MQRSSETLDFGFRRPLPRIQTEQAVAAYRVRHTGRKVRAPQNDFLKIFAFPRFWVGLLRFLCKSFSIFLQRLPCLNEIRRNDECSLPFLKQSRVLILQLWICPALSFALKKKHHRFSYILQTPVLFQKCCTEKFGRL